MNVKYLPIIKSFDDLICIGLLRKHHFRHDGRRGRQYFAVDHLASGGHESSFDIRSCGPRRKITANYGEGPYRSSSSLNAEFCSGQRRCLIFLGDIDCCGYITVTILILSSSNLVEGGGRERGWPAVIRDMKISCPW